MSGSTVLCPACNASNASDEATCWSCRAALEAEPVPETSALVRMLIPVGRSAWAVAAGYVGLVVFAPLALVGLPDTKARNIVLGLAVLFMPVLSIYLGLRALRELKMRPRLRGRGRAWFGIVAGVLMLLFVAAGMALKISSRS